MKCPDYSLIVNVATLIKRAEKTLVITVGESRNVLRGITGKRFCFHETIYIVMY